MTADEHLRRQRDPSAKFETDAYVAARDKALLDAGLHPESVDDPVEPAAMDVDQHLRRIRTRAAW